MSPSVELHGVTSPSYDYCKSSGVISRVDQVIGDPTRCDFSFFLLFRTATSPEVIRLNALLNFVEERVFGWCEFYEQSDSYGQALTFETGLNLILIVLVVPVPVGI